LLYDGSYIKAVIRGMGARDSYLPKSLTNSGHDLLEDLRRASTDEEYDAIGFK